MGRDFEIFREIAGQRRGQVIAQRQPLLVVVLEGEDALVGPVLIGQEFSQRLGQFNRRGLDRVKTVKLVSGADRRQHGVGGGDLGGAAIDEAARQARFDERFDLGDGGFG